MNGYDAHLFIKKQGKRFSKKDIAVLTENKEKYISFNVEINVKLAGVSNKDGRKVCKNIQLRFIDSCRFLGSGLDKLASNLCGTSEVKCDKCRGDMELIKISDEYTAFFGCERCRAKKTKYLDERVLKKNFSTFWGCDEKFHLIIRKGVYPYEHMDGWGKSEETNLPPKDAFYSRFYRKGISDQDHEYAEKVWNIREEKTLGWYHDTYLKADVLLLADRFETFCETCLKHYKLDPAHFHTAPSLAWKTLLKMATEYCEQGL